MIVHETAELTFAIPVYNQSEAHLRAALASVLTQDGVWNLIVVDDSPAGTYAQIVASFMHPRIRYVRNSEAHGIGNAWNRCLAEATSTFVTIVHADDELKDNYATVMRELARRHPSAAMYFCFADVIDDRGRATFSLPDVVKTVIAPQRAEFKLVGESGLVRLCVGDFIMCPTVMYRREDLRQPAFSDSLRQVVDLDLYLDALFTGRSIVGTRTRAYRYRRHASSTTKTLTDDGGRFREEVALYFRTAVRADGHSFSRAASMARWMPLVRINLALSFASDLLAGRLSVAGRKLRLLIARSEASLLPPEKSHV